MKLIIAIVKPEKLTCVKQALVKANVGKMTEIGRASCRERL